MRSSTSSALGSGLFFVIAPGSVVGLFPWLITGWDLRQPVPYWIVAQIVGAAMICLGVTALVHAFVHFARAHGTPAPVAPTAHLVVSGGNTYVRNPMYVAIMIALLGQALLFASWWLVVYTVAAWAVVAAFVRIYEEPTLARQFGAEYDAYRRHVRAWIPRLRPWQPTA